LRFLLALTQIIRGPLTLPGNWKGPVPTSSRPALFFLKIGNALAKVRYREAALRLLNALESDPKVRIVPASEHLYRRALEIYRDRSDKEWGLIDYMSFVVMTDHRLTDALTADKHFHQAGFHALLLV
jgi:uncharacterized protein